MVSHVLSRDTKVDASATGAHPSADPFSDASAQPRRPLTETMSVAFGRILWERRRSCWAGRQASRERAWSRISPGICKSGALLEAAGPKIQEQTRFPAGNGHRDHLTNADYAHAAGAIGCKIEALSEVESKGAPSARPVSPSSIRNRQRSTRPTRTAAAVLARRLSSVTPRSPPSILLPEFCQRAPRRSRSPSSSNFHHSERWFSSSTTSPLMIQLSSTTPTSTEGWSSFPTGRLVPIGSRCCRRRGRALGF